MDLFLKSLSKQYRELDPYDRDAFIGSCPKYKAKNEVIHSKKPHGRHETSVTDSLTELS